MSVKKPREEKDENNSFRDFGYFTDKNGIKHFGIIPRKNEEYEYRRTERKGT